MLEGTLVAGDPLGGRLAIGEQLVESVEQFGRRRIRPESAAQQCLGAAARGLVGGILAQGARKRRERSLRIAEPRPTNVPQPGEQRRPLAGAGEIGLRV